MFLQNPFTGAFGLNIGDLSIKLMQLERRKNLRGHSYYYVKELRTAPLSPGCIVNGEIQQPEMIRKKILYLLGREGRYKAIKSPWVVADLPEPKTFLKVITLDANPDQVTEEDVIYQAKKHLPFEIEETYLDWKVLANNSESNHAKVLVGAVPKVTADSYTYLLESVGLTPLALEIEVLSIARALVPEHSPEEKASAILDLGATRSSLIFFDHEGVKFSTHLNFSGEILTTAIAQEMKLDYDKAEALKIERGITYSKQDPKYLKIISKFTDELVSEVNKAMSFYQEHFAETDPIQEVNLCGGSASLKNLPETISRKLKVRTTVLPLLPVLRFPSQLAAHANDSSLASVVGLALRAAQNPFLLKE